MKHTQDTTILREELLGYIETMSLPQLRLVLSFIKSLFNF